MLLIKETFKNSEDKFRITNSLTETLREKMPYENLYPAHVHDTFIEFEIVHKGHMSQIINGTKYELTPGSIAILKPTDCHSLEWSPDAEIITVHFFPGIISKELLYLIMQYKENIVYTFSGSDARNILNSSMQLFEEYEKNQPFYENIIKNLIETICYSTLRNLNSIPMREKHLSPMQKAVMYLQTTFMNNPSLDEVAHHVHLNPSYFSRVFKAETGITYSKYLIELKLKYAKKLLCETNMTITDICFSSGFGSISNFSKCFKANFKMSANEMRKQYGKIKLEFYNEINTTLIL